MREGNVFTGVCLSTGGGVPQPLVPSPFWKNTLASGPRSFPVGYPNLWSQGGVASIMDMIGVPAAR